MPRLTYSVYDKQTRKLIETDLSYWTALKLTTMSYHYRYQESCEHGTAQAICSESHGPARYATVRPY